jgi:hypothetical protein
MTLKIDTVRKATNEEWLDVSKRCRYATFFHTPMWASIFSRYTGAGKLRPDARMLMFSDKTVAILPMCRRTKFGLFPQFESTPAGNFGGIISADNLTAEHAELANGYLNSFKNVLWRENPYDPSMAKVTIPDARNDFTQSADLSEGIDPVYKRWSRGHVNAANKAKRLGVAVNRSDSIGDWNNHYENYIKLRSGWSEQKEPYRKKLFEILAVEHSPEVALWVARLDGCMLSSVVCFYWNRHVVLWHSAAIREEFAARSNHLMFYEIMKDAALKGFQWFDMNPSDGHAGVVNFKEHLGMQRLQSRVVTRLSGLRALTCAIHGKLWAKK